MKNDINQDETTKIKEEDVQVLDFNNPDYSFIPQGRHLYRQQGPYLVCFSCEIKHAVWLGMDKKMVGEDEKGNPIINKVVY